MTQRKSEALLDRLSATARKCPWQHPYAHLQQLIGTFF